MLISQLRYYAPRAAEKSPLVSARLHMAAPELTAAVVRAVSAAATAAAAGTGGAGTGADADPAAAADAEAEAARAAGANAVIAALETKRAWAPTQLMLTKTAVVVEFADEGKEAPPLLLQRKVTHPRAPLTAAVIAVVIRIDKDDVARKDGRPPQR